MKEEDLSGFSARSFLIKFLLLSSPSRQLSQLASQQRYQDQASTKNLLPYQGEYITYIKPLTLFVNVDPSVCASLLAGLPLSLPTTSCITQSYLRSRPRSAMMVSPSASPTMMVSPTLRCTLRSRPRSAMMVSPTASPTMMVSPTLSYTLRSRPRSAMMVSPTASSTMMVSPTPSYT